jgi:cytochrome c556
MASKLITLLGVAAIATAGFTVAASAQGDPITQRKAILKGFGAATGPVGGMMQGKAPYDQAKVQAALDTYIKGAAQLPALFPDNSKTGGKTEALPAIWGDKADFNARFAKLSADAKAAKVAIKDEASFKANMGKVLANCGGCHEKYRQKK